jgi:NADH dehydrogenase [ubiquinone] 1 alpha subcomplex assembly factor 5
MIVDVEEITVNYPTMFELMLDLQAMGENNALQQRKLYTSKDVFLAASAAYKSIYGNEDGTIPATFQIIHMIGWKPHESQPKPLKRGSATRSFKEIDQLNK